MRETVQVWPLKAPISALHQVWKPSDPLLRPYHRHLSKEAVYPSPKDQDYQAVEAELVFRQARFEVAKTVTPYEYLAIWHRLHDLGIAHHADELVQSSWAVQHDA